MSPQYVLIKIISCNSLCHFAKEKKYKFPAKDKSYVLNSRLFLFIEIDNRESFLCLKKEIS